MYFMNQWEIEEAKSRYQSHPVLGKATRFLHEFMEDVNSHSDGWAYWSLPVNAAKSLMQLIESARQNPDAVTETAFKKTLAPIKSFYTRRGNAAGMKMPSLEPAIQTQTNPLWDNDLIQFARLLAELRGSGALTETIWNELATPADAQSWRGWWKHHHILCMCIGNPPVHIGGN